MEFTLQEMLKLLESWLPTLIKFGGHLAMALVTLLVGWQLINQLTRRLNALLAARSVDRALNGFVGSLAGVALKVMLLISVAAMLGVETTSFVAALGAAGLAIGLSLQGSLSNFAGGVLILVFRPFRLGDWIEAQGVAGTVDSIQIFHTVLKTGDNKTVIVPNGSLSNGNIINYSREERRRVDINLGIDYGSDIRLAREVLLEIAGDSRVLADPAPVVFVTGLGDNAVNLSLRVWVKTADYWPVTFEFTERAKEGLTTAGIGIPFPQRVVHLINSQA